MNNNTYLYIYIYKYTINIHTHNISKEYVFKVRDDDKSRLNMLNNELDMHLNIRKLGVEVLELANKAYADAPSFEMKGKKKLIRSDKISSGGLDKNSKNKRPDLDSFMFNEITASTLQEWAVIKTNMRGKRQERVMGIDSMFIHNRRPGETGKGYYSSMKRTLTDLSGIKNERSIKDIVEASFIPGLEAGLFIIFKEKDGGTVRIEYEAETSQDAAEIIAKISYIRKHLLL